MNKTFKVFCLLTAFSLFCFFSCAAKKESSQAQKAKPGTETMTEGEISSEQGEGKIGAESKTQSIDALERVFFDFDDVTLRADARETLKKDAEILQQSPTVKIQVEGHCDERGSVEYNLALGERRAESVKKYLSDLGISTQRLSTISYGKEKPLVIGHNEDAWSKNRRGELMPK